MVVEEGAPSLGGRVAAADYILAHARFADVDAQLEQLAVNPRSAPERSRGSSCESTGAPPWARRVAPAYRVGSSWPSKTKAFAVPGDDGRRFDDKDAGLPVVPDRGQASPEKPISSSQFRAFDGALKNAELMVESEDLKLQQRAAPEGSENSGPESGQ